MIDMKVKSNDMLPTQKQDERDKKLKKACHEFESMFTYELLKSMRRTIDKCDLFHGGKGEDIYESMLDQEMAKVMSGGGRSSLGAVLYEQIKRRDPLSGLQDDAQGTSVGDLIKGRPLWPLRAKISSGFGLRKDPINGDTRFHHGIDLAAEEGTLVRAALPGRVLKSEFQEGYGNVVMLAHEEGLTSLYAHNQHNLVEVGEWVREGTALAKVGSSGRSTGPHLHFEVRKEGEPLDPEEFFEADL